MSSKAMSLKAKVRNHAKNKGIAAQVVLQNYMFERLLERISLSEYKDKIILKGGVLIAALVGLETRSTMDLDTTVCAFPLDEVHLRNAFDKICTIDINDDVLFKLTGVTPTRKDDVYGGFRVSLESIYDTITTPLSIDITSGDALTPGAVRYSLQGIFDENKKIELWTYNIETILAEKVETILRRGVFNTRSRDFYDVYILTKTQKYSPDVFHKALDATATHRDTKSKIADVSQILDTIAESSELKASWSKYQREFSYAANIAYENVIVVLRAFFN